MAHFPKLGHHSTRLSLPGALALFSIVLFGVESCSLLTPQYSPPITEPTRPLPLETRALPPAWTPTTASQPTPTAFPTVPTPTGTPTSAPTPYIPDQNDLNARYPEVDLADLYLFPNQYSGVSFRLTSVVVWTGYHEAFYPGTPVPVAEFIVQLDPRIASSTFQFPFVVVGIPPSTGVSVGDTLTVYGYGLGSVQGENAAGGVSNAAAIYAESFSIGN